jgi:hypothetical protein
MTGPRTGGVAGGALAGALFGATIGVVVGLLLARHNALPTLDGATARLVLFCALVDAAAFAAVGLAAGLAERRTRLPAPAALAGAALFLFGALGVNSRVAGGPLQPPGLFVNLGLAAAGLAAAFALRRALGSAGGRRSLAAAGLAAVALALAVSWRPRVPREAWAGPPLPAPGARRLALIGLDGATWDIALPLVRAGRMPVLARLMEEGVHGALASYSPAASPLLWTTMVTGKGHLEHGISQFEAWSVPFFECGALEVPPWAGVGKAIRLFPPRQTESGDRRTNALWNILSEAGWTVGFSSWWASYPAEPVRGFNISDHFTFVLKSYRQEGFAYLEESGGAVYPDSLKSRLIPQFALPDEISEADLARFFPVEPGDLDSIHGMRGWEKPPVGDAGFETPNVFFLDAFALPYLDDLSRTRMMLAAIRDGQPDLLGFYIRGIDDIEHHFWHFREPEKYPSKRIPPEQLAKFRGLIDGYYAFADSLVGVLLDALDPGTQILVVSDHGQVASGAIPWSGTHFLDDPPPGLFVAAGPGIRRGETLNGASVYDVAPTILAALGFPAARDHVGRPLREIFAPADRALAPRDTIDSYDRYFHSWRAAAALASQSGSIDEEMAERLRALGYMK